MAQIPPNSVVSIIGGVGAGAKEVERRAKTDAANQSRSVNSSFGDSLDNVIRNDDRDSSVSADAESFNGGQGRQNPHDSTPSEPEPDTENPQPLPGGQLDIQA